MAKIALKLRYEDGREEKRSFDLPIMIGKQSSCELCLKSWRVAKEHASLFYKDGSLYIHDLGSLGGTMLNAKRIYHVHPVALNDEIIIGPCLMQVLEIVHDDSGSPVSFVSDFVDELKVDLVVSYDDQKRRDNPYELNDSIFSENRFDKPADVAANERTQTTPTRSQQFDTALISQRNRLHKKLVEALDLKRNNITMMDDSLLREKANELLQDIVATDKEFADLEDVEELCRLVLDEAVGLGPLESLLKDPTITEIMVNRYDEIYIERHGQLEAYPMSFSSNQSVTAIIDRIVAPLGRRIDESSPMVDARLKDGSRVNAVLPPIAIKGANLTIRKFPQKNPNMQDLISLGSLDEHMAHFLDFCVKQRMNMIISGGTGSGKTTLLNILSNHIPVGERIVTIEDAAELRLNHEHLISLESRPPNTEGRGQISIRDLVKNALRMRPDRIVVGECRGAEALDMLVAMNTGHDGSLTTLHANSPRDALSRLEVMILMAGMDLPLNAIREQIASSIDFIIQQTRLSDGRRVVSSIIEVAGMESGVIKTQELFSFERGAQGGFKGLGIVPERFEGLREQGLSFDISHFQQHTKPVLSSERQFI